MDQTSRGSTAAPVFVLKIRKRIIEITCMKYDLKGGLLSQRMNYTTRNQVLNISQLTTAQARDSSLVSE